MSDVTVTMSPTIGKIAAALAKAQAEMKPAIKDGSNPAFKGSKYASLVSYLEAALPVLNAHGIAVLQPTMAHGPDGVCVATLLVHDSGEWMRGELYMPASKKDAQGFGSALTYARRYSFASMICLGADDDDGAAAVQGANTQRQEPTRGPAKTESDPVEQELTGYYTDAQSADDIAKADATAARYSQQKRLTGAARERLLKLRASAVNRAQQPVNGAAS